MLINNLNTTSPVKEGTLALKPSFCYLFIMKKKKIGRYLLSVLLVGVVGVSVVFSLSVPVDSLKYHIYRMFGDTPLPELPLQFPENRLSPDETKLSFIPPNVGIECTGPQYRPSPGG